MEASQRETISALRSELRQARQGIASASIRIEATTDVPARVELNFSTQGEPFALGEQRGTLIHLHPNRETSVLLAHVEQGGASGLHAHDDSQWETVLCVGGCGWISFLDSALGTYVTVDLTPGHSARHAAGTPHDFYAAPGSSWIIAFAPPPHRRHPSQLAQPMKILVERISQVGQSTLSVISIDGKQVCYGLEDIYRPEKVFGKTRIPAGTYPLVRRYDGRHFAAHSQKYRHKSSLWIKGCAGLFVRDDPRRQRPHRHARLPAHRADGHHRQRQPRNARERHRLPRVFTPPSAPASMPRGLPSSSAT